MALLKLALVAPNEIVSIQDDSAVYAAQSIGRWTLGYPQGYPIWLALCREFNLPQRIAIEVLYLIAALTVAWAVNRWFGVLGGYLTFGLLAFSSSTIFLFNLGLADGLFVCLTLFALGFTILVFLFRNTYFIASAVLLGGTFGAMAITRNEDPLLLLWIALLVATCAIVWRPETAPWLGWKVWRTPLLVGLITSSVALLAVWSLCLSYYYSDGVFARGVALIPGHVKLLNNLAQIYTAEPLTRFVPISRKSREMAYAVSPTFAKYRPMIENPADGWQVLSREFGIPNGEIGGGWIWHAINTKVIPAQGGRPALAEAEYNKINSEIQKAFKDGRLKRRFILHPLIGGSPVHLLAELPPSIAAVTESALSSIPENRNDQAFDAPLFDKAFVRRSALVLRSPEMAIQGWAFVNRPGHRIVNVMIGSQIVNSAHITTLDRPDVVNAFGTQNGWKPAVIAFRTGLQSRLPDEVKITYLLDDGSRVQNDHLQNNQVKKLENKVVPGDDVIQGIDLAQPAIDVTAQQETRHQEELTLFSLSQSPSIRRFNAVIVFLGIVVAVYGSLRTRESVWKSYLLFLGLTLLLVCFRILFYSVLDARAWPGNQIRYLAPAHVLWLTSVAVSVSALVSFVRSVWPANRFNLTPAPTLSDSRS